MSGHSKWSTICKQKSVTDAKRGAIFTKLARNITLAVRDKGGDPDMNAALRTAMEKAKEFNMPKDNIEKAIKRGTGEIEGMVIEEIMYEGFGPEGIGLIIKCVTDNKNRTAANIRHILTKFGGNLGEQNSVAWMFEQKGAVRFNVSEVADKNINLDDFELSVIDAGATDIKEEDNEMAVYTRIKDLQQMKEVIGNIGVKIVSAELEWVAKDELGIKDGSREKLKKLIEALDDNEDVQAVYYNVMM